eukprot:scaffold1518_cov417-Prasinococcus_capsulatus_cf.AAC.13
MSAPSVARSGGEGRPMRSAGQYLLIWDCFARLVLVDHLRLLIDGLRKLRLGHLLRCSGLYDVPFQIAADSHVR